RNHVGFSAWTYTATLDWKPTRDTLVYITNNTGYRSGGYQASAQTPSQFLPYKPEKVVNFEVGLKTSWSLAGTRGWTSIAAFTERYKQIQRNVAVFSNNILVSTIANAAQAKMKGFEIETTWSPTPSLQLSASWAYLDARYSSFAFASAP